MQKKQNSYQKKIITIPNMLSFFRLCLIPVIVWLYCFQKNYLWTSLALVLSGITDVVDGMIARHFDMVSDFGKIFDPIADKLTQFATLLCLLSRFHHMLIPAAFMVVKEIFAGVTGLLAIRKSGSVEGANWHGKATTVCLYAMMLIHLIWHQIPLNVSYLSVGFCTALMLLSAVLYSIRNLNTMRTKKSINT